MCYLSNIIFFIQQNEIMEEWQSRLRDVRLKREFCEFAREKLARIDLWYGSLVVLKMTSRSIGTIHLFMESFTSLCLVTFWVLDWLVHKILFSMSEFTLFPVVACTRCLEVLAHLCLILGIISLCFHRFNKISPKINESDQIIHHAVVLEILPNYNKAYIPKILHEPTNTIEIIVIKKGIKK